MIFSHSVIEGFKGESTLKQFLSQALSQENLHPLRCLLHDGSKIGGLLAALFSAWDIKDKYCSVGRTGGRRFLPSIQQHVCPPEELAVSGHRGMPVSALGLLEVCALCLPLSRALGGVICTKVGSVSHLSIFISTWIQGWGANFLPCCTQNWGGLNFDDWLNSWTCWIINRI